MQRTYLSKWFLIAIFSLVAGAIGWKIADSILKNDSEISASIEKSPIAETENISATETLITKNTELDQNQDAITDTTPAELVLMLKIIFPATNDQMATAIIQHREKQSNAYESGQTVFNIATLKEINADHVILLQGKRLVKLSLRNSNATPTANNTITAFTPITPDTGGTQTKVVPGSIRDLARQASAKLRADKDAKPAVIYTKEPLNSPDNLRTILAQAKQKSIDTSSKRTWAFLQYKPDIQVDGMKGLRLTGSEESDFLAQYGIEFGDTITSVNGQKLNTPAAATEGMNVIGESDALQLIIDRSGQKMEISIDKNAASGK
jgi:type II secretory pathway component PulC